MKESCVTPDPAPADTRHDAPGPGSGMTHPAPTPARVFFAP